MNNYKKIKAEYKTTIDDVVELLLEYNQKGEKACLDFNGVTLYSDTVTLKSAYLEITGETKEGIEKKKEQLFNEMLCLKKELKDKEPDSIEKYKQKARGIIKDNKLTYWDEIVPTRVKDLYHGYELDCVLEIGVKLNKGVKYFQEAKKVMIDQNHSGMSWSLVKALIKEFCVNGEEFVKILD